MNEDNKIKELTEQIRKLTEENRKLKEQNILLPGNEDNQNVTVSSDSNAMVQEEMIKSFKNSKKKYKSLIDALPQYIYSLDRNLNFVSANKAFCEAYSIDHDQIIGKNSHELFSRDIAEAYMKSDQEVIEKGEPKEYTEKSKSLGKGDQWVHVVKVPVKDEHGNVNGMIGIYWDITERKQTEIKLKQNEEQYRTLFDSAKDAIFIMDSNVFINCNDSTVKMFECDRKEDILGHSPWEFSPADQPDGQESKTKAKYVIKKAMEGEPQQFYWQHIKKDGTPFDAEVSLNSLTLQGTPLLLAMVRDITQRKKTESRLKFHAELQKLLMNISTRYINIPIEDVPNAIKTALKEIGEFVQADRAYVFDYDFTNNTCSNTYEWCGEGIQPQIDDLQEIPLLNLKSWSELHRIGKTVCIPDISKLRDFRLKEILELKGIKSIIAVPMMYGKECHGFVGFDSLNALRKHSGREKILLELFAHILINLRLRSENEKELINTKRRAVESDRLKSAFLTNLSHEIRTPMNGILGFTNLLKEPKLSGEEQQEYIDYIEKSGARMLNTINDLIDISQVEAGQVHINYSVFNINDTIDGIYALYKPEAEKKSLKFTQVKGLDDENASMKSDPEKISAILKNLVRNAIKFTREGFVEFGYTEKDEYLEFYVHDTGIGISENKQKAIFDLFVQANLSYSKVFEGTGLGLSICKAYVEMLEGSIWLESEEMKGSRFYFTIPVKTDGKTEIMEKDLKENISEDLALSNLKILIVEDDDSAISFLKILLQKISREILIADTGRKALMEFQQNPDIDLILMDIKIPDLDGYETTREIRKTNQDVVIIAQTAYALVGDRDRSLEVGCNEYITKPIQSKKLFDLIEKYFRK